VAEDENAHAEDESAEEAPVDEESTENEPPAEESVQEGHGEATSSGTGPTQDELRAALDRVGVSDVLVEALMATVSLGFRRVSPDARDLPQAKLAIESLRALEPVLREGGVDEGLLRDLEQARMNLQLAYASAVAETAPRG
jgi:hypothetical protein